MAGFGFKNKSARNDLRPVDHDAGFFVKSDHYRHHAVFGEDPAFLQDAAPHVADPFAVDEHAPRGDPLMGSDTV